MSLITLFKAGMLPICAIIISLAPFTTFSQPQTLQNYNNTSTNAIIYTPFVKDSMMNTNVSVANSYMSSESDTSILLYHQNADDQGADQAISSSGIQAKPKSWILPKRAWVETKRVKEQESDAMWDIVTRKENGTV
ncbi:uncharacterized protein ATC70_002806 [Mucor velutinosus]|uniref:Secreted protein n=1 Tax=Mucor velutinosus TaxID=708070 RepID=A0AAN7I055_9FUNG|nr:hypothetical protein ATC70_002806 [Mucor velutinosus]